MRRSRQSSTSGVFTQAPSHLERQQATLQSAYSPTWLCLAISKMKRRARRQVHRPLVVKLIRLPHLLRLGIHWKRLLTCEPRTATASQIPTTVQKLHHEIRRPLEKICLPRMLSVWIPGSIIRRVRQVPPPLVGLWCEFRFANGRRWIKSNDHDFGIDFGIGSKRKRLRAENRIMLSALCITAPAE